MNKKEILKTVDHTVLTVGATMNDITKLIDDAIDCGTYSVCISPCFVQKANEYAAGRTKIATVIGFPSGNHSTRVKVFETECAIEDGADEIDMVVNVGDIKAQNWDAIQNEIKQISESCHKDMRGIVLKVIIETCLLTDDEIAKMCEIVKAADADYIKTSTGFSTGGATFEDVALMKKTIDTIGGGLKIKASGGISSFEDAQKFIELGADRLGTSRLVKLYKN